MTVCKFYEAAPEAFDRRLFAIVENAYNQKEKILIFAPDDARAAALDRTLWILKQEAFIPHRVFRNGDKDPDVPVAIVTSETNPIGAATLIADGHCSLDFACRFETVHEFVRRSTPELHQACRERYRNYKLRQAAVEYCK